MPTRSSKKIINKVTIATTGEVDESSDDLVGLANVGGEPV
jgi:hypothetical protein